MSKKNNSRFYNGQSANSIPDETNEPDTIEEVNPMPEETKSQGNATIFTQPAPTQVIQRSQPKQETAKPAAVEAPKAAAVSANVAKLVNLINQYEASVKKQDFATNGKFESITKVIAICEYLNSTNDPAVFEYFFRYYQTHRETTMHNQTVLKGIHTVQNPKVKTRVDATISVYEELARVRSLRHGTYHFTINAMKIMGISELQGRWIIEKSTNRK